jgi:putative endonuclease
MKKFTSNSQKIGELGENVACKYLENKGFVILERNYTKKWGEIDIIAIKGYKLYFIEIKSASVSIVSGETNKNNSLFNNNIFDKRPEDNMHPWKLKRLAKTVQTYLIQKRIGNTPWQFDLLVVYLDLNQRKAKIKTIENIIL